MKLFDKCKRRAKEYTIKWEKDSVIIHTGVTIIAFDCLGVGDPGGLEKLLQQPIKRRIKNPIEYSLLVHELRKSSLRRHPTTQKGLIRPPGMKMREILYFIYPKKTAERVFGQTIADMQEEWTKAMVANRTVLARWVHIRGGSTIVITMAVHAGTTLGGIFKLVK